MRLVGIIAFVLIAAIYGMTHFGSESTGVRDYRASKEHPIDVAAIETRNLTTREAYGRIQHRRTPFRGDLGRMPTDEAFYLEELFGLTDSGVVERVHIQGRLAAGEFGTAEITNYPAILAGLKALPTPEKLMEVEALIFEALTEQARHLDAWRRSGNSRYHSPRAPLVQSSHRKLIAAYQRLMKLYPAEGRYNKKAFFDHICALDFI